MVALLGAAVATSSSVHGQNGSQRFRYDSFIHSSTLVDPGVPGTQYKRPIRARRIRPMHQFTSDTLPRSLQRRSRLPDSSPCTCSPNTWDLSQATDEEPN